LTEIIVEVLADPADSKVEEVEWDNLINVEVPVLEGEGLEGVSDFVGLSFFSKCLSFFFANFLFNLFYFILF
jgi:hypothetical protein